MTEGRSFFPRAASGLVRTVSPIHAMFLNLFSMLLGGFLFVQVIAPGLYPGIHMPGIMLIQIAPALVIGFVYVLMSISMPRTGGDYIWVGRSLHPAVGFMMNFYWTVMFLSIPSFILQSAWQMGIGGGVTGMGVATGDQGLVELGAYLADIPVTFVASSIFIIIAGLAVLISTKNVMKIALAMFIFNILGYVLLLGSMLISGHDSFVAGLAKNGIDYNGIIDAARSGGYVFGVTASGIMLGIVYGFLNCAGYTHSAYISGEMKSPQQLKTQMTAIIGSVVLLCVLSAAAYAVAYYVLGFDFVHALSFLWNTRDPAYTMPFMIPGSLNLLAYMTSSAPLIMITSVLWFVAFWSLPFATMFMMSRNIFAWSFDRVIPSRFSAVTRQGVPYLSVVLAIIIALIFNVAYIFTNIAAFMVYQALGWAIAWVFVGIAAIAFPYRRKDILKLSPSVVSKKVGGAYLLQILGVIMVVYCAWVAYSINTPELTGTMEFMQKFYNWMMVISLLIAPIVIYAISYAYHKRKGIALHLAHKELPAE